MRRHRPFGRRGGAPAASSLVHALCAAGLSAVATPAAAVFLPNGWVADRVERYASESLGIELDVGDLDVDLLSSTSGGTASDVSIGDGAARSRSGDA